MNLKELREEILPSLAKAVRFSLLNNLNMHTSIGGKFAELYVASELWEHSPKFGQQRLNTRVENPGSCDIILATTDKKLEVKWAMFHHREDDVFVKRCCGIPFWGWGFSKGKQFIDGKLTIAF